MLSLFRHFDIRQLAFATPLIITLLITPASIAFATPWKLRRFSLPIRFFAFDFLLIDISPLPPCYAAFRFSLFD